jgi:hypothetical protein
MHSLIFQNMYLIIRARTTQILTSFQQSSSISQLLVEKVTKQQTLIFASGTILHDDFRFPVMTFYSVAFTAVTLRSFAHSAFPEILSFLGCVSFALR